jgi:hypothetical protein
MRCTNPETSRILNVGIVATVVSIISIVVISLYTEFSGGPSVLYVASQLISSSVVNVRNTVAVVFDRFAEMDKIVSLVASNRKRIRSFMLGGFDSWAVETAKLYSPPVVYFGSPSDEYYGLDTRTNRVLTVSYKTDMCIVGHNVGSDGKRNISGKVYHVSCSYQVTERGWFQEAAAAGHEIWTLPYIDFQSGEICITHAIPSYSGNGELIAVVAMDLFLSDTNQILSKAKSTIFKEANAYFPEIEMSLVHKSGLLVCLFSLYY